MVCGVSIISLGQVVPLKHVPLNPRLNYKFKSITSKMLSQNLRKPTEKCYPPTRLSDENKNAIFIISVEFPRV